MSWRTVAVGVALAALLLVGGLVTQILSGVTGFSTALGVLAGLVAAAVAIGATYRFTRADAPDLVVRVLTGLGAFGYTLTLVALLVYADVGLPGPRLSLTGAGSGLVVGLVAAVAVSPDRVRPN